LPQVDDRRADPWYLTHLACPRDHLALHEAGGRLACSAGHSYPVVDGVPVMLLDDVAQTMGVAEESMRQANAATSRGDELASALYLETLGISDDEKRALAALAREGRSRIDPVVAFMVGATSGYMYKHVIGTLASYPIPELRLPDGGGKRLLDIGCNWGRWSIAAARKGYDVVGIDPQLGAVMAARRVCRSLGVAARFIVGDARYLPFPADTFDFAFSYSVLQHLSREDVRLVLSGVGRTLASGGTAFIQMPTVFGIRCLYHQARRRFKEGSGFDVRYWTVPALERIFSQSIGPATTSVDCYFGIGLQRSDRALMPAPLKAILTASEVLREASRFVPPLKYVADSVYVTAVKR
jgi:SAM-dependent methyltransferase/uncharacterized protein YbaR (Trm112 family)